METNQKLTVAEYDKLVENTDDAMLEDKGQQIDWKIVVPDINQTRH